MDLLKNWFLKEKRELPWRKKRDPYATWVAEVMLQQTVASVVVPYFLRWMEELPTLEALASAPKEKVFKLWEGLGYYSRVRNLMKGAAFVLEKWGGKIPSDRSLLQTIPGIGPYTSAAIATFCFQQKVAAVDANVARFIARFLALEDKALYEKEATRLLPDQDPHIVAEALIEMGATVCRKKPDCQSCPVKHLCIAYAQNRQYELPLSAKRPSITHLEKTVAIIFHKGKFLVKNPESKGVMADLWEFPSDPSFYFNKSQPLSIQKHTFTRFSVTLKPYFMNADDVNSFPQTGFSWYSIEELKSLTFSAGHKRILKELDDYFAHGSLTWLGRTRDSDL